MAERGATEPAGAEAPYYLWPGVPIEATGALALLETSGYDDAGAVLDMVCSTSLHADPPPGVDVRAVDDGAGAVALVDREWPWWRGGRAGHRAGRVRRRARRGRHGRRVRLPLGQPPAGSARSAPTRRRPQASASR